MQTTLEHYVLHYQDKKYKYKEIFYDLETIRIAEGARPAQKNWEYTKHNLI